MLNSTRHGRIKNLTLPVNLFSNKKIEKLVHNFCIKEKIFSPKMDNCAKQIEAYMRCTVVPQPFPDCDKEFSELLRCLKIKEKRMIGVTKN